MRRVYQCGFSLIEVVIAVGVVIGGVAVVLALIPTMARQVGDSRDAQTALHLADAVSLNLDSRARAGGLSTLVGNIPVMDSSSSTGLILVAAKDGSDLRELDPAEVPSKDEYFYVAIRRFGSSRLAYGATGLSLTVNVVVSWPYRTLVGGSLSPETPWEQRQRLDYNVVIANP